MTFPGTYANRTDMSLNGTLEISKVKARDKTTYKCTVKKTDFTSPLVYFVTLDVDSRGKPICALELVTRTWFASTNQNRSLSSCCELGFTFSLDYRDGVESFYFEKTKL